AEAVAAGAVADLVVVLHADDEAVPGDSVWAGAVLAAAGRAVVADVQERLLQHPGKLPRLAEVGVVPLSLAGQVRVDGVVKIVAPLPVQTVAAALRWQQQARVVEVALGDDVGGETPAGG